MLLQGNWTQLRSSGWQPAIGLMKAGMVLCQEVLISHVVASLSAKDTNRLVILESEQSAAQVNIEGITAFCLVNSEGNVNYYTKQKNEDDFMEKKAIYKQTQKVESELVKLQNTVFALQDIDF